jgi:signal transduction histidine kinase
MALEKSNFQVKKMTSLINSFLNVSQLEAGRIRLYKQPFDLGELIRFCIDEISLTNSRRTIDFHCDDPMIVHADKNKLESVLLNLFGNAIKYSPEDKLISV